MIENKNRNEQENASIAVAEDSRETDWKSRSFMASLFMGELDVSMAFPFPEQPAEDRAAGDAKCAEVDAWCQANLDGDAIDRDQQIPAHVWKGLAELGLFGIKIPQRYGGLGMSQTNYMRILQVVARYCGSTAATLSAHQSIGVPQPLKLFGTEEQRQKYLPRFAKGAISAFALTESTVGSDPANLQTTATKAPDGGWVLNGEKLWCTNGVVADVIVVMAKSGEIEKGGRKINQISAFIVETDQPGVEVLHRCRFLGIRAIENGIVRFTDVKIPAENLIWGEGKGLRLALTTLNDGRLSIPAIAASTTADVSEFVLRWAKARHQWGKLIGDHEAGADKLARLAAGAYAMDTLSRYCAALSDRGDVDMRMEAAAAKMYNSELSWELMDTALQLRGGRGYETEGSLRARGEHGFPMERALRDTRINRIVEGTTDIMHLFLAREALDGHLRLAGPLLKKSTPAGEKLSTLLKCAGFYARWYPKLLLGGLFKSYLGFDARLAKHLRWVDKRTRKLSRVLFHNIVLQGPKLEMRQLTLGRIVTLGTELAVMGLVACRAQSELRKGDSSNLSKALYWLRASQVRADELFRELRENADAEARALAKELMAGATPLEATATPALQPLPKEKGEDLTSGRITARGEPAAESAAK